MYNYMEEMKTAINDLINWNEYDEEIINDEEALYDALWIDDYVTGNGSGSYTFNRAKAKEYVLQNFDLVKEMADYFCLDNTEVSERMFNDDWEWLDVSIRCYLLGEAISEVMEERNNI